MVTTLRLMPTSPSSGEGGTSVGGVRDVSGTPVRYVSGTICQACIRTSHLECLGVVMQMLCTEVPE